MLTALVKRWFKYLLQLCWFVYCLHDCNNNLSNNCWSIGNILEQLAIITFWLEWKVIERAGHYYSYYHSLARQVPAHPLPWSQERSKNILKEFQIFTKYFKKMPASTGQKWKKRKNILNSLVEGKTNLHFVDTLHFFGNSANSFLYTTGFLPNS